VFDEEGVVIGGATGLETEGGGGFSSTGESGGGGISVPSVRLKFIGASAGSSKRPLRGLPLLGIMKHWVVPDTAR